MKIKNIEDMQVWQGARNFIKLIYNQTARVPFNKDYGCKEQLQRAAISILTNISEGFERDNNKEFIRFLTYSKGSAGEVRCLLYVAFDLGYITKEEFEVDFECSISIITQLSNFIKYLKSRSIK